MHETQLEEIKFNLDRIDRYENTYFLAGWVLSSGRPIDAIRVSAADHYSSEQFSLDVRPDVNKFYELPEQTQTGFKFILTPDQAFDRLIFSVKFAGEQNYQAFATIKNQRPVNDTIPKVGINNQFPGVVVVDNFYDNPDLVREYAMTLNFNPDTRYHKGRRTEVKTIFDGTKEFFERILNKKVTVWDEHVFNGVFQYCTAQEQLVYHTDNQTYAAVVYLTPDAPPEGGTSFYRSKFNGLMRYPTPADCERHGKSADELFDEMFAGNFYDKTRWELVDTVGNVYNRMVIFDAKRVHAATTYFGDSINNSRLFHMFFFDAE